MELLKVAIVFLLLNGISGLSNCPSGFTRHNNICYILLPVPATWAESLTLCDAVQAHLARIENAGEDQFINKMLKDANSTGHLSSVEVWLGGTDMLLEGMWVWVDAEEMESFRYTNWAPNQPDNGGGQHCLGMWSSKGFLWDDNWCDQKNYPLCRIMLDG